MIKNLKIALFSVGLITAGGVIAAAPILSTDVVAAKLDSPWDMSFLKDGTMFFTEKCKGLSVRTTSSLMSA